MDTVMCILDRHHPLYLLLQTLDWHRRTEHLEEDPDLIQDIQQFTREVFHLRLLPLPVLGWVWELRTPGKEETEGTGTVNTEKGSVLSGKEKEKEDLDRDIHHLGDLRHQCTITLDGTLVVVYSVLVRLLSHARIVLALGDTIR